LFSELQLKDTACEQQDSRECLKAMRISGAFTNPEACQCVAVRDTFDRQLTKAAAVKSLGHAKPLNA